MGMNPITSTLFHLNFVNISRTNWNPTFGYPKSSIIIICVILIQSMEMKRCDVVQIVSDCYLKTITEISMYGGNRPFSIDSNRLYFRRILLVVQIVHSDLRLQPNTRSNSAKNYTKQPTETRFAAAHAKKMLVSFILLVR